MHRAGAFAPGLSVPAEHVDFNAIGERWECAQGQGSHGRDQAKQRWWFMPDFERDFSFVLEIKREGKGGGQRELTSSPSLSSILDKIEDPMRVLIGCVGPAERVG